MSLFSCKDTVRRISRSLDRALSLGSWLLLRAHLLMCPRCSRYRQYALLLRDSARRLAEADLGDTAGRLPALSAEARARIKRVCEDLAS